MHCCGHWKVCKLIGQVTAQREAMYGISKVVQDDPSRFIYPHGTWRRTTSVHSSMLLAGEGKKTLTLDEDCGVDCPHTHCCSHSDLISVPNGNASNLNECRISEDRIISR